MEEKCKIVEGVPMPIGFSEECFRSALKYKAKPGEIYIVTYPKCGTSWMHNIVLLILRKGEVSDDPLDFFLGCPFMEVAGTEYIEKSKSRAMKTHLPYYAIPYSDKAKYIYVARNPGDCCVSLYYHMKLVSSKCQDLTFDKLFEDFISGNLGYGDYFDHLLEWYNHRNDENVYFVTFEDLKKDIRGEIRKISKFLEEEYEKIVLEDSKVLENIVRYSSFDYMKVHTNKAMDMFLNRDEIFEKRELPSGFMEILSKMKESNETAGTGAFIRKGIIGDWKNHFNEEQKQLLDAKIAEKAKESDFVRLWENV